MSLHDSALYAGNFLACAVLCYTSFCRLVFMGRHTSHIVRSAILLLFAFAPFVAFLPLWVHQVPQPAAVLIELCAAYVQASTGQIWRQGTPGPLRRAVTTGFDLTEQRIQNRRAADRWNGEERRKAG